MGGSGSGRNHRFHVKRTVEEYLWIDAQEWWNRCILEEGGINVHWGWPNKTGIGRTRMKIRVDEDRVKVEYTITRAVGKSETLTQWIPFESTPCHFGGERYWFRCPNGSCERRVRRLYRGRQFFCRLCHRLNYASQHENHFGRACRKVQKIRLKLGGSANLFELFPLKPKGMHYATHEKLFRKSEFASEAAFIEMRYWSECLMRGGKGS